MGLIDLWNITLAAILMCNAGKNLVVGCRYSVLTMDCRGENLTNISRDIPKRVRNLLMGDNQIQRMTRGDLFGLVHLKHLNLHANTLTTIQENAFRELRALEVLDISDNRLRHLQAGCFTGLSELQRLYLSDNQLTRIDPEVFAPLTNLQHLDIGQNIFVNVATYTNLSYLTNLVYLRIDAFSRWFTFDSSFQNFTKLKSLDLSSPKGNAPVKLDNNSFGAFIGAPIENLNIDAVITNIEAGVFLPFRMLNSLKVDATNHLSVHTVLRSLYGLQNRNMTSIYINHMMEPNIDTVTLTEDDFKYLKYICVKSLTLRAAKIAHITTGAFMALRMSCIESLDLSDNSFLNAGQFRLLTLLPEIRKIIFTRNGGINGWYTTNKRSTWTDTIFLPKTLEFLNISFNTIHPAGRNGTVIAHALKVIDISNQVGLKWLFLKFSGLHKLEVFNISHTDAGSPAQNMLEDMISLKYFVGRNIRFGYDINLNLTDFFKGPAGLKHVDLSLNHLNIKSSFLDKFSHTLRKLILSQTNIETFPLILVQNLVNLDELDLTENKITTLDDKTRDFIKNIQSNAKILMTGNPFVCSCESWSLEFLSWFNRTPNAFADGEQLTCTLTNRTRVLLKDITRNLNEFNLNCESKMLLYISIAIVAVIIVSLIVSFSVYKNKFVIQYVLLKMKKRIRGYNERVEEFRYDCFICYSGYDSEWVRAFYERLSGNNSGLKFCLYDQDFPVGLPITDCIIEAIDQSRRVLFVVTYNFLHSEWCKYEMQMARIHMIKSDQEHKVILIFKDQIKKSEMPKPIRAIWNQLVCLQWPGDISTIDHSEQSNIQPLVGNGENRDQDSEILMREVTENRSEDTHSSETESEIADLQSQQKRFWKKIHKVLRPIQLEIL